MALSHSMEIEVGSKQVTFDNTYIKVTEYHGNKSHMTFVVSWSESVNSSHLKQATYGCSINLDGENPVRQAYLYLKTLPEFADAVDC